MDNKGSKRHGERKNSNFLVKMFSSFTEFTDDTTKITGKDKIIIAVLVVICAVISFYHFGTVKCPKTYYNFAYAGDSVGIEIDGVSQEVSKMRYYTGAEIGDITIMVSNDGKSYKELQTFTEEAVFAWEDVVIGSSFKYAKFMSKDGGNYLGDIQLYNKYGEKLNIKATDNESTVIVDETNTVPNRISNINSSYFDEIYFARSAYEYANGLSAMEWVHPPLGKLIMAIPVAIMGMSTFSYRLMGVIAGILMVPVLYIFAKRIFKKTKWASLAGILMTFDSFRYTQSRLGTVDTILVLFIMLSALFMYQYLLLDKKDDMKPKLINLGLSGLFIGCAIATKWTGLYAGLALAVTFFGDLYLDYRDKNKKIGKNDYVHLALLFLGVVGMIPIAIYYLTTFAVNSSLATTLTFGYYLVVALLFIFMLVRYFVNRSSKMWKLFIWCFVFFAVVPLVIYVSSYVLFPNVTNYKNTFLGVLHQIKDMYHYHSTLVDTHPFSSGWFTWPFMTKPIWYYVVYYGGNVKSTIVAIGNPAIWWMSIVGTIYMVIDAFKSKNKSYMFLLIFIACCWLPYAVIGRVMFLYHFFPVLPFAMLAVVAFIKWITEKSNSNNIYWFYIAVVLLMFALFYPVTSGIVTTSEYVDKLRWLKDWYF